MSVPNAKPELDRTSIQFRGSGIQTYNSDIHVARDIIVNGITPSAVSKQGVALRQEVLYSLRFQQMDDRQRTIGRAHAKTCQWFLETPEYKSWLNISECQEHGGFLWVKGNPGSGKSTLMKLALDRTEEILKSTSTCILVFFFNARGVELEKSTAGLYRTLLVQLLSAHPEAQHVLDSIHLAHHWSNELLKQTFERALMALKQQRIICFIDALDECGEREIREMISWLDVLSCEYPLHVCFASRHYPHIAIRKGLKLILEDEENHIQDISYYLKDNLYFEDDSSLAEQIRADLRKKASGIFIWVVLVVDILNKEYDAGQKHTLREKIRKIPADLHELFYDILTSGVGPSQGLLFCLQWILFAKKPLSPMQLYLAILSGTEPEYLPRIHSTDSSQHNGMTISENDAKRFILNNSRGLAETTKSTYPTVQFIHESVKDFLLKENGLGLIWNELKTNAAGLGQDALRHCCLRYQIALEPLLERNIPNKLPETVPELNKIYTFLGKRYPFLEYANHGLLFHSNHAERNHVTQKDFLSQFPLTSWRRLHNIFARRAARWYSPDVSLLYVLVDQNYPALIQATSLRPCFEIEDGRYGAPIFRALAIQNYSVLESLLQAFFEGREMSDLSHQNPMQLVQRDHENTNQSLLVRDFVFSRSRTIACHLAMLGCSGLLEIYLNFQESATDQKDDDGRTPLFYAAENGHDATVKLLINHGANASITTANGEYTPLRLALSKGHLGTTKLLISSGANPNAPEDQDWSLLLMAVSNGRTEIAKLLLDHGANANATEAARKCSNGRNPLHYASTFMDIGVAKRLLDHGAELNACDDLGETALFKAVDFERREIAKLLIDHGADVNPRDKLCETPLHRARERDITKLLIDHGADVNARDESGQTSLHKAGEEEITKLLIDHGADVHARDKIGQTPLHKAVYQQRRSIARLLIDYGADIDIRDDSNQTSLHIALHNREEEMTKLLISSCADVNALDAFGQPPLHLASYHREREITKLLIAHGADVNARDESGQTLLHKAGSSDPLYEEKQLEITKLLTDHGADVNARDSSDQTPLHKARDGKTAELLIDCGADVNARNSSGKTPLHLALHDMKRDVVQVLISSRADTNARDIYGDTPLRFCCRRGVYRARALLSILGVDMTVSKK